MYHYFAPATKNLTKPVSPIQIDSTHMYSREAAAFDPLHYAFDPETMSEPFTYFHDGPGESRRKPTDFSSLPSPSSFVPFQWSPASSISPSEEKSQGYYHSYNPMLHVKYPQQAQPPANQYPKTICRHCKSHNMPECLYTSHSMYDESGEIFCPVLKKCHCTNCIRVINSSARHDEDSDDDNHLRYPSTDHEFNHCYGIYPRASSYRMNNNF